MRIAFQFFALICIGSTACHRIDVFSQYTNTSISAGEKVFVQLVAPKTREDETLKLMPEITRALRKNGLVVSSSVENLATTPEWRERSDQRLKDFAPTYILTLEQHSTDSIKFIHPEKAMISYSAFYKVKLRNQRSGETFWAADVQTKRRFVGVFSENLATGLIAAMRRDKILPVRE